MKIKYVVSRQCILFLSEWKLRQEVKLNGDVSSRQKMSKWRTINGMQLCMLFQVLCSLFPAFESNINIEIINWQLVTLWFWMMGSLNPQKKCLKKCFFVRFNIYKQWIRLFFNMCLFLFSRIALNVMIPAFFSIIF